MDFEAFNKFNDFGNISKDLHLIKFENFNFQLEMINLQIKYRIQPNSYIVNQRNNFQTKKINHSKMNS